MSSYSEKYYTYHYDNLKFPHAGYVSSLKYNDYVSSANIEISSLSKLAAQTAANPESSSGGLGGLSSGGSLGSYGVGYLGGQAGVNIEIYPFGNPQWYVGTPKDKVTVMALTDEEAAILAEIRAKGNSASIKKETITITTITEKKGRRFKEAT